MLRRDPKRSNSLTNPLIPLYEWPTIRPEPTLPRSPFTELQETLLRDADDTAKVWLQRPLNLSDRVLRGATNGVSEEACAPKPPSG